jgi:aminopeptidase N
MDAISLTQLEAEERAALLDVDRYDVDLDLTGLADGPSLVATSTVTFTVSSPGASTFIDCLGEVEEAVLNGRPLDRETPGGRLHLPDLEADNTLVVRSVQRRTEGSQGVHRAVDSSDGRVYVWMSFEPDEARVVFACFDQPDLKATFGITVRVPEGWLVTSNTGDAEITTAADGTSTWRYGDTPRLSTYVPVVNAGPFVELRSSRGGYDLGLFARRSLAAMLDRDAEELFDLTARGLAFYGEQFDLPFPQARYDQVFVPDMGGAMENYGCITWSDRFLYRNEPSYVEREFRAYVLLHEMAHMWFGDMVTMRWWDDLWLNESFADWAAVWSGERCTEFTAMRAGVLATEKLDAYAADAAPTTHPIRQAVPDVEAAQAAFDDITYPKGAATLRQLVAYVGEESFVAGLRTYFRTHLWATTTLDDLVATLADASGRDLSAWVAGWLETAGTDLLALDRGEGGLTLTATPPAGREAPLPHRMLVGGYAVTDGALAAVATLSVEVAGEHTWIATDADADLWLPNDDDLTFARVRPDDASLELLLTRGGELPTTLGRTLALTTAWRLLYDGELAVDRFVDCGVAVLSRETTESVVEPLLGRLVDAADLWAPPADRDRLLSQVADLCVSLADDPGRRLAALRGLGRSATTAEQLDVLATYATEPDLRWRRLLRLAELDRLDDVDVERLIAEDPDPEAWVSAWVARAARPTPEAKAETWTAMVDDRRIPPNTVGKVARAFWRPGQEHLLAPYAERYLALLPEAGREGMTWSMVTGYALFPVVGGDDGFLSRLDAAAQSPGVSPVVRQAVRDFADRRRRRDSARMPAG